VAEPVSTSSLAGQSVQVANITHYYETDGGVIQALDDCSLEIRPGRSTSIVGPSGCGKSTLLHIMAGLIRPTAGLVTVDGIEIKGPYRDEGIVFQTDVLLDWRTALDNVLLQMELRGMRPEPYRARASALLDSLGLAGFEDRHPYELSGGMRQRVSICRALLHEPKHLFMDEPFGALDAMTRDQIGLELQIVFQANERTVFFVTHSIQEAVFLSDRVMVMSPRPGTIQQEVPIDLPRPRSLEMRTEPRFVALVRKITEILETLGAYGQSGSQSP
jgi:NitT/TauT family transport system ATP-binding protein